MSDKKEIARLEAALKHTLFLLSEKQENGRPQTASIRASMSKIYLERALAGGTDALDEYVKDAERRGYQSAIRVKAHVREAKSINCGECDFCPAVHVNLIDAEGDIFATASVPCEIGEQFIAHFRSCMTGLARRSSAPTRKQ